MPNATVAISVSTARRLRHARNWLADRAKHDEVLIAGATLDAANELTRDAAKAQGVIFGWHRYGWVQFVRALAAPLLAERDIVPLTRLSVEALVTGLVHRLALEGQLAHYQTVTGTRGFRRSITEVVTELRMASVRHSRLEGTAPQLIPILDAYERELTSRRFCDFAGLLELATESVLAGSHRLALLPALFLDISIRTEAELALARALASASSDSLAIVPSRDIETLSMLHQHLEVTVLDLDTGSEREQSESALSNLQARLFGRRDMRLAAEDAEGVEVFSAPGENRECVEIVRRVLALAEADISFDRMAVLLRSPADYRAQLVEAFSRAGVPAHFARGAVRPDAGGRAFCTLLECAAENLSAQRFAEYLSLAQVPDAAADGAPPAARPSDDLWTAPDSEQGALPFEHDEEQQPDAKIITDVDEHAPVQGGALRAPRRWERLLVEAAVIGGHSRWQRRISGLTNQLRLSATASAGGEAGSAAAARNLADMEAFSTCALPLIDDLASLPGRATWGVWLERLGALATRAIRRPTRIFAVLAELAPMADTGPVDLTEVLDVLRNVLLESYAPPPAARYGKVFVAPTDAARGLSFDAVFVPGLAEKMFPQKIVEEPILLDAQRSQLHAGLVINQTRLERERLALALAVGAAETRICLSFPRIDLDHARPRVPSFYALEALRAAEGRLPDFGELGRRAEAASESRLGWPAPVDPRTAIDDAEHDLAVLADLAERTESAGRARYLLGANPHLARALRSRYQRWSAGWTAADGLLAAGPEARAILERHDFAARSYSPTALQSFAHCPYRFLLRSVHGLMPREVPISVDELDPLQRGSLIHDVQFELLRRLRTEAQLPIRPDNLEHAYRWLDEVIAEIGGKYEDELAPAIDRVWQNGVTAIRADLREWLRRSSEDPSGFVPVHFELAFGLHGGRHQARAADAASVPDPVELDCGIFLRGSIDLVEAGSSGLLRVTDHKTGKSNATSGQIIQGGKTLQPVLYALAAEKLLRGRDVVGGRLYFSTSNGGFTEVLVELNDAARQAALRVSTTINTAIDVPFLPAAPAEDACARCDYRAVCGPYEELRVTRKPQDRLGPLISLRDVP